MSIQANPGQTTATTKISTSSHHQPPPVVLRLLSLTLLRDSILCAAAGRHKEVVLFPCHLVSRTNYYFFLLKLQLDTAGKEYLTSNGFLNITVMACEVIMPACNPRACSWQQDDPRHFSLRVRHACFLAPLQAFLQTSQRWPTDMLCYWKTQACQLQKAKEWLSDMKEQELIGAA